MQQGIHVEGLSKQFYRYHADRPTTMKEAIVRRFSKWRAGERFWALRDVTFDVPPGEILGVIGRNGAGKSTLLHLIGGVGRADRGTVWVPRPIAALLELGAAFHPELNGRENIFVSSLVAGLTRAQTKERLASIIQFAELEPFIDNPIRTYSSGMKLRLAFAIGVHTSPRVLLIDEVLAVGDLGFQQKCIERILKFKSDGCSIVLVSHDMQQVGQICDRTLWLEDGTVSALGNSEVVVQQYELAMTRNTRLHTPTQSSTRVTDSGVPLRTNQNRFGSMELEITSVRLLDTLGDSVKEIRSGDPMQIELGYTPRKTIESPIFMVSVHNAEGEVCSELSTAAEGIEVPTTHRPGKISLNLERLDLTQGEYFVDVGAYPSDWRYAYDFHWRAYSFQVRSAHEQKGVLSPPHTWQHSEDDKA